MLTKSLSQYIPEFVKLVVKKVHFFKNATEPLSFDPGGIKKLSFFILSELTINTEFCNKTYQTNNHQNVFYQRNHQHQLRHL